MATCRVQESDSSDVDGGPEGEEPDGEPPRLAATSSVATAEPSASGDDYEGGERGRWAREASDLVALAAEQHDTFVAAVSADGEVVSLTMLTGGPHRARDAKARTNANFIAWKRVDGWPRCAPMILGHTLGGCETLDVYYAEGWTPMLTLKALAVMHFAELESEEAKADIEFSNAPFRHAPFRHAELSEETDGESFDADATPPRLTELPDLATEEEMMNAAIRASMGQEISSEELARFGRTEERAATTTGDGGATGEDGAAGGAGGPATYGPYRPPSERRHRSPPPDFPPLYRRRDLSDLSDLEIDNIRRITADTLAEYLVPPSDESVSEKEEDDAMK